MNTGLKINWYPIQVPNTPLIVDGAMEKERGDYRNDPSVRAYPHNGQFLIVNTAAHPEEPRFGQFTINCDDMPKLTTTLLTSAFLDYFQSLGFLVDWGMGEGSAYREKSVRGIPDTVRFFEGLRVKPFSTHDHRRMAFGMVIDYKTHQEFATPLAHDEAQKHLALHGGNVLVSDGSRSVHNAMLVSIGEQSAVIRVHGDEMEVAASAVRLSANFQTIRDYFERTDRAAGRNIIRTLLVESYSLVGSGAQNIRRLADRHKAVSSILGRDRKANISLKLGTLCQSIASLATEPSDVELRFQ